MSYKSDLTAVLEANRKSVCIFTLTGMLEALGIKNAGYIHQGDVYDYISRYMERQYGMGQLKKD